MQHVQSKSHAKFGSTFSEEVSYLKSEILSLGVLQARSPLHHLGHRDDQPNELVNFWKKREG